jgi:Tfp pilus assembly PilM family ATPase
VATRQDYLQDYLSLVNQAGLIVKVVDVDSFALLRALYLFYPEEQIISILDINSSTAQFIVFQKQELIFNHLISMQDFTREFHQVLQKCFLTHPQIKLNIVVLSGTIDSGKDELLKQEFNLQCIRANPFFKMSISPKLKIQELQTIAPRMLVSCGLALRSVPQW